MPDIKLLRGTQTASAQTPTQQGPGLLGRLGHAALRGVELPVEAVDSILNLLGQPPLKVGSAAKEFGQYVGAQNPSQLEPQSFPEAFAQRLLHLAPGAALIPGLAGGSVPASLARTAVGSIPAAAAQRVGVGPLGQDIIQIGTEVGLGRLPSSLGEKSPILKPLVGKIPTLPGKIKEAQKGLESIPTKPTSSSILENAVQTVQKKLSTETRQPVENLVQHALNKIESNIFKGKIEPKDVINLRKTLYKLGDKLDTPDAATYIQPLTKGINEFFASYAAENPAFFNKLTERDRLTELRNMRTIIDDFANLIPANAFGGVGKGVKDIINGVFGSTIGEADRFFRGILTKPAARKHYFDVVKASINNDPTLFIRSIADLGAREKEFTKSVKEYPGVKVLQGSRI